MSLINFNVSSYCTVDKDICLGCIRKLKVGLFVGQLGNYINRGVGRNSLRGGGHFKCFKRVILALIPAPTLYRKFIKFAPKKGGGGH